MSLAAGLFFFVDQARRLLIFFRHHSPACWHAFQKPTSREEIDDPIFALLTRLSYGHIPPQLRVLGSFEAPEEDDEEPARTERALRRFFCLCRPRFRQLAPGDALNELQTWLADASGSRRGVFFVFVMLFTQILTALALGFASAYGSRINRRPSSLPPSLLLTDGLHPRFEPAGMRGRFPRKVAPSFWGWCSSPS